MKVFIVEDDKIQVIMLQRILYEAGIDSGFSLSSEDIVQKVIKYRPDIILLDLVMPLFSGYDICNMLVKDEHTKNIPILIISSEDSVSAKIKCLSSGSIDFLDKPVPKDILLEKINKYGKIGQICKLCEDIEGRDYVDSYYN